MVTLALAVGYGLAHAIGPAWLRSGLVFNLIGGSAIVALVIGARRNADSSRVPWYLFAVGVALFVTSGVLSWNYERLFGTAQPFPSVADQFHLAFYPFLVGGMLLLVRERRDQRDRAPLIDSMIVTTALATLLWVYLIAPYAGQTGMSLLRRSASVAYPAMDILLLGVVARVAAGSHRREPAFLFVLAAAIGLLITDVIYGSVMLGGSGYGIGGALDAGWAIFYAFLGAAALHPSMRQLSARGPAPDTRLTRQRLALLASASLTVPLVIVVRSALHQSVDLYVLIAASGIMFALVLMRLAGIVHHNEAATQREAALRVAGETLVSAPTRDAVYEAALEAAHAVVDMPLRASLYWAEHDGGPLEPVGPGEGKIPGLPRILPQMLPDYRHAREGKVRVVAFELAGSEVCIAPMFVRERLEGALAVVSERQLPHPAQESLATLASEVALALQSITAHRGGRPPALRGAAELADQELLRRDLRGGTGLGDPLRQPVGRVDLRLRPGWARRTAPQRSRAHRRLPAAAGLHRLGRRPAPGAARVGRVPGAPRRRPLAARGSARHQPDRRRGDRGDRAQRARHQRAQGLRGRARAPGLPRRRSPACPTARCSVTASATRSPASAASTCPWRSCSWTSTTSRTSTTASATPPATSSCRRSPAAWRTACARSTPPPGSAGTSSRSCIHEAENELQAVEIAQRVMDSSSGRSRWKTATSRSPPASGSPSATRRWSTSATPTSCSRNADTAMYMAKESGKGHYQIFQPEMHAQRARPARAQGATSSGRSTAASSRCATSRSWTSRRGDIAGMEALVRWEHPTRGLVQPLDFIPLLEDTGLIVPVGGTSC